MNRDVVPPIRAAGAELRYRWISSRLTANSVRKRLLGLHGAFKVPADSPNARALTTAWNQARPGSEPGGHPLQVDRDRMLRFHSLPKSKRYADTAEESAEIIHRHRTVIDEISDGAEVEDLIVIATDWGPRDIASGWSKRRLPGAWPWIRFTDEDGITSYYWVRSGLSSDELDVVLTAVADGEGLAIVAEESLSWLYRPYDGGADVVLPSTAACDALRDRHPTWLPA